MWTKAARGRNPSRSATLSRIRAGAPSMLLPTRLPRVLKTGRNTDVARLDGCPGFPATMFREMACDAGDVAKAYLNQHWIPGCPRRPALVHVPSGLPARKSLKAGAGRPPIKWGSGPSTHGEVDRSLLPNADSAVLVVFCRAGLSDQPSRKRSGDQQFRCCFLDAENKFNESRPTK
jgi:hypothetical protein